MREILLNAVKDANASAGREEWMRTRILTKAFAFMPFFPGQVLDLLFQNLKALKSISLHEYMLYSSASDIFLPFFKVAYF